MDLRFTIYDLRLTFAAASECPPVSRTGRDRVSGESYGTSIEERTTSAMPAWFTPRASRFPSPRPSPLYVFSALVGMARCAVPARVVAGGTNIPAILAFQGVAPLHAARTSQRDVPTTLNTYSPLGRGRMLRCRSAKLSVVSGRRTSRIFESAADCSLPMKLNVGQAFQPAGLPDFLVRWTKDWRVESRTNPQAGKPALRASLRAPDSAAAESVRVEHV